MNKNFTIIIPHKNNPDLLQRCVNSIPERDDVQIIVIDDNSDEDKRPSINRIDIEVIILDADQAKGAGRARNVGLEQANGKWLLFADSDDYYKEGFLEILDKYVDSSFNVIYFSYEHRDGKTNEILPPQDFHRFFEEYDGSKLSKDQVRFHHNVPWTKMVLRDYLRKNDIIFEETPNGNDILFSMKVGYYTENITVIKQPLYVYVRNENSIITTKENAMSALCRLTHLIKCNYFYGFIGHAEWKSSVIKRIFKKILTLGFPFLYILVMNAKSIYKSRKEWVVLFNK